MRRALSPLVVLLVAILKPAAALAQEAGPPAGAWGAEAATTSSASLLRFRTPRSAWLIGVSGGFTMIESQSVNSVTGVEEEETSEDFFTDLRLGFRDYSDGTGKLRRFSTLSGIIGYNRNALGKGWRYGAGGELGAAYFFNPHVSLGASGEVVGTYSALAGSDAGDEHTIITIQFSGFRLLGAVYF